MDWHLFLFYGIGVYTTVTQQNDSALKGIDPHHEAKQPLKKAARHELLSLY